MKAFKLVKLWGETPEEIKANYNYLQAHGYSIHTECMVDEEVFLQCKILVGNEDGNILRGYSNEYEDTTYEWFLEHDGDCRIFLASNNLSEKCSNISDNGAVDMVNNPSHYTSHPSGIECIEVTRRSEIVSDGGSSSYYQLVVTNKAGESIQCETGDILRVLVGNDYDLSNIVKACRRSYEASQGRGKAGASIEYDMNKVKYFADEFKHWNKSVPSSI